MGRSRDKAAEIKAYEAAVEAAARGESVDLKSIRVLSGREQRVFQQRVAEKHRGAANRKIVEEGKLTLAYAGMPTRTGSDILRGASSSRNLSQQPASVQKYVRTAQLNSDFNQGRIGAAEYKRRLQELRQDLSLKQQQEQMMRDRTSTKQAQSASIKQREQREIASRQGVAVGTVTDGKANVSANSQVFKDQKVSGFVDAQKNLMSQTSQQMQRDGRYKVETPDGETRTFKDRSTAEKFVERTKGKYAQYQQVQGPGQPVPNQVSPLLTQNMQQNKRGEPVETPYGSLQSIYGQNQKITKPETSDNILEAFGNNLYNALRYSDRVDSGEVEKPKGLENLVYYSSKGLSPLYNIPLQLAGDKRTSPTLSETVFDTAYQLATTGKTKTHDPIGDYIRKDPLGTLVQLPAEALLWKGGEKAVKAGTSAVKIYSPIQYQSKQILTNAGKVATVIRSITYKNNPVISIQDGKIVKGFDPGKIPYEKINVSTREGFEGAMGSGIERELFYGKSALENIEARKIIPKIAKTRAEAWVSGVDQAQGITSKPGTLGKLAFQDLTQEQADHIIAKSIEGQKLKLIDLIHGSPATRGGVPKSIQKEAGSSLKLGDLDITPMGKNLSKTADKLIRGFAEDFPLSPGQRIAIRNIGKEESNRQLVLIEKGKPEKKVVEVVMKSSEESKFGIGKGDKILGYNIPFKKSVTLKDYPIKTQTADYQLLTNVKQALAFQKGTDTPLDIYTSSGRVKDIVRGYWNLKAKAVFGGGVKGEKLDKQSEYIRSLYPKLEFTDYNPEKVMLYSSRTIPEKAESNLLKGSSSEVLKTTNTKVDNPFDDEIKSVSIKDKPSISIKQNRQTLSLYSKPASQVASRPIESLSRYQRNIPSQKNISIISKPSRGLVRGSTSNKLGGGSSSNKASLLREPSIKTSLVETPSAKDSLLKQSSSAKPPSLKALPPRTSTKNVLSRVPQSRTTEKPIQFRKIKYPAVIIPPAIKNTTDKAKGTRGKSHNFLGGTRTSQITGWRTTKKDIDVGDKRTAKLYKEDILWTKRKYKKSDRKNTLDLLGSKKSKPSFW